MEEVTEDFSKALEINFSKALEINPFVDTFSTPNWMAFGFTIIISEIDKNSYDDFLIELKKNKVEEVKEEVEEKVEENFDFVITDKKKKKSKKESKKELEDIGKVDQVTL